MSADRPGFIVNRILMPFLAEAMRAFEEGVGTAEDIDTGARVGLNHPMGPLELADFIGLDVCLGIMEVLHEGLGERAVRAAERPRASSSRRVTSARRRAAAFTSTRGPELEDQGRQRRWSVGAVRSATVLATVSMSNGLASNMMPRATAKSCSSGLRTSPLMNAKRLARSGSTASTASWNAIPLIPAIRWSQRIARGGSERTISSAAAPSLAGTGS